MEPLLLARSLLKGLASHPEACSDVQARGAVPLATVKLDALLSNQGLTASLAAAILAAKYITDLQKKAKPTVEVQLPTAPGKKAVGAGLLVQQLAVAPVHAAHAHCAACTCTGMLACAHIHAHVHVHMHACRCMHVCVQK